MNKLETLIQEGKELYADIVYVEPPENVFRNYDEYDIVNKERYFLWLNQSKNLLNKHFCENSLTNDFVKLSKTITPDAHLQMVSILEALQEEYNESPSVIEMLQELERLEKNYIEARKVEKNSAEAIGCFNEWYNYAIKIFYNAVGDGDSDFERLKAINTGSNGYGLSYAFDEVMASYVILKEKLKNPPKSVLSMHFTLPTAMNNSMKRDKTSIFISYSHQDKKYLEWLQKHLKAFQRQNRQIEVWDDTKIKAGDKWKKEIESALEKASVAFLLVSKDFLASDFVMDEEIPKLLQKCSEEGTLFIPIILTPCLFDDSPLGDFQAINTPDTPLSSMSETEVDQVFVDLLRQVKSRF